MLLSLHEVLCYLNETFDRFDSIIFKQAVFKIFMSENWKKTPEFTNSMFAYMQT